MLILGLMLPGMVSDPRRPVHGYRRRAGAATVRYQDFPFRTPNAMEFGSRNLVHSHPRHSREVPERLLHRPMPSLHHARESDCCCPVRSDLRRTREEPEQPHRCSQHIVESGLSSFWHLHLAPFARSTRAIATSPASDAQCKAVRPTILPEMFTSAWCSRST